MIVHCLENWLLIVRAKTPEVLESVREAVHGDWVNWWAIMYVADVDTMFYSARSCPAVICRALPLVG
ncbi:hypothetical protein GCM10009839_89620 [Catenulispora yoronensis]|uniref:Uncharacterized protein n=1 Tax=Catenulispora yoronensis TaxID=450799 RepID=A0ABP5H8S9_9ACTN